MKNFYYQMMEDKWNTMISFNLLTSFSNTIKKLTNLRSPKEKNRFDKNAISVTLE